MCITHYLESLCLQDVVWFAVHFNPPSDKEHTFYISVVLFSFFLINTCVFIETINTCYAYRYLARYITQNTLFSR